MKKRLVKIFGAITAAVMGLAALSGGVNAYTALYCRKVGTCHVTAYSGNNGRTYGASGEILIPGVSCAAGRDIPFGTRLYIKDFGFVTVHDRFDEEYETEHSGMVIDLYLESYDAACEWGAEDLEVYIVLSEVDAEE